MSSKVLSDRYVILEKVGVGGMATVYKARDTKLNRIVAVKVLDGKMVDQVRMKSFFREVDVMSRMHHENCVQIYDHGIDGDTCYIVMEYVRGVTLQKIIDDSKRISPNKAVKYAVQILAALSEAHKNGIIHRDIKPQNILVDQNGMIKVADFGIARLVDGNGHSFTEKDMVLGSVHYLSPEQAQGETVDGRSDLYSVGVVLYEMLTGAPPFDAENAMRIVYMHCNEAPVSMRARVKSISPSIDEVILKALAKNPDDRFKTAGEMSNYLKRALKRPNMRVLDSDDDEAGLVPGIRRNVSSIILILLSIATVTVLVGVGCGRVMDVMFKVEVPNVYMYTYDDAVAKLDSVGLDSVVEYTYADDTTKGRVILQSPAEGTRVSRSKDVKLLVSQGLQPVQLPDVRGYDKKQAVETLADYGFREISFEYACDESRANDTVLAITPEPGEVSPSCAVTITLNTAPIELPVLCGRTTGQALDILEALNLNAVVITAYSPDEAAGTVVLQSPAPGEKLIKGSTVTLAVTLDSSEVYYCDYRIRVPLFMRIRAVLKSPSGFETLAYDADAQMDDVITLHLTGSEPGEYTLTVYYGNDSIKTETLEFK